MFGLRKIIKTSYNYMFIRRIIISKECWSCVGHRFALNRYNNSSNRDAGLSSSCVIIGMYRVSESLIVILRGCPIKGEIRRIVVQYPGCLRLTGHTVKIHCMWLKQYCVDNNDDDNDDDVALKTSNRVVSYKIIYLSLLLLSFYPLTREFKE